MGFKIKSQLKNVDNLNYPFKINRFRSVAEKTTLFPLCKKERQNRILFKSWGDSPKRKTCISANVCVYLKFSSRIDEINFDYQITLDILNSAKTLIKTKG